jgi:hypothetical protein
VCQIAPRVLHHLDQLDPEVFDHRPVDFDHLRCTQTRGARGIGGSRCGHSGRPFGRRSFQRLGRIPDRTVHVWVLISASASACQPWFTRWPRLSRQLRAHEGQTRTEGTPADFRLRAATWAQQEPTRRRPVCRDREGNESHRCIQDAARRHAVVHQGEPERRARCVRCRVCAEWSGDRVRNGLRRAELVCDFFL